MILDASEIGELLSEGLRSRLRERRSLRLTACLR